MSKHNNRHEINKELYDLLKEPLQLHENLTKLVLTIEFDQFPVIEQTYWLKDCKTLKIETNEL